MVALYLQVYEQVIVSQTFFIRVIHCENVLMLMLTGMAFTSDNLYTIPLLTIILDEIGSNTVKIKGHKFEKGNEFEFRFNDENDNAGCDEKFF